MAQVTDDSSLQFSAAKLFYIFQNCSSLATVVCPRVRMSSAWADQDHKDITFLMAACKAELFRISSGIAFLFLRRITFGAPPMAEFLSVDGCISGRNHMNS